LEQGLKRRPHLSFSLLMQVTNAGGGLPVRVPTVEASGVRATKNATDRAAQAAVDTTRAFHPPPSEAAAIVNVSSESRDLGQATVDLISATAEMKAGATLIRTGDELTQETLSMLDRKR
jgi:hypothetical protein